MLTDSAIGLGRPAPGDVDPLDLDVLEAHAARLGDLLDVTIDRRPVAAHLRQVRQHGRALRRVYTTLNGDALLGQASSPASEWLLDNFHVIAAALRDILRDLPASFYRRLPAVTSGDRAGEARIAVLADELLRSSAGHLDARRMHHFVTAFQSQAPLTMGELWALPSALKLAAVRELRRHGETLVEHRAHRVSAERLVRSTEKVPDAPHAWTSPVHPAFVIRLLQLSRERGTVAARLWHDLETALGSAGQTVEDAIRIEAQFQATAQAFMANLIGSLRLLSTFEWSEFFEGVSLVEDALRRDPAGVYAQMDFRSRDRYRHAVEDLADPTGESQIRIALLAVERARRAADLGSTSREAHVGYHLIGRGRQAFERDVGWRPAARLRLRRLFFRQATPLYLGAILAGTAALVALAVTYAVDQGARWPLLLAVALLTLVPASEVAIQILHRLVSRVIPPRRLPRLELTAVPPTARTMVVVPVVLDSVERVRELAAHVEVQALANLDPHIHFAILSDFADAASESVPEDAAILAALRAAVAGLAARHARHGSDRFFLFHRTRRWNASEGRWIGWERKRGKIEEFNRLLRGATDTSFSLAIGELAVLPHVRYCITLDADTRLPRDAARHLIGIASHPLHRPTLDPAAGRVTDGYGILQPRVAVSYTSLAGSLFARLHAGHTGVDPYTTVSFDTYQDLFGEGIFAGKGLYDVEVFAAALAEKAPDDTLLSHDLFEGLHARVALVSDVEIVEEYPSGVLSHAARQHRWIRGDWQMLRWLLPSVPSRRGSRRNSLSLIARWKILDNLRRSLVTPGLLSLLIAGWVLLPGSPSVWTASVVLVIAAQLLPVLARLLVGHRRAQAPSVFWRNLGADAATACAQALLGLTFLAHHAWQAVHAIAVTVVRVGVTRRRLLEWETFAATESAPPGPGGPGSATGAAARAPARPDVFRMTKGMLASPLVAGGVALWIVISGRPVLPVAMPFLLLWLAAPAVAYWLSVPVGARQRPLTSGEREIFRRAARKTWRYFETFADASSAWLPPDNYQEFGETPTITRRTSPTNIAMGLLSTLAAHDLGYLSTDGLARRLDLTLTTLEALERHEGHFLNWYDTTTLAPLHPRYVSTVDSGNLAGALIALAQGLARLPTEPQTLRQLAAGLEDTADLLAVAARAGADTEPPLHAAGTTIEDLARRLQREAGAFAEHGDPSQLQHLASELAAATATFPATGSDAADDVHFWSRAATAAVTAVLAPPPVPDALLTRLAERAAALADEMRFDFLYDRHRRIFAIGYRLADVEGPGRCDDAFYDLLASEARLASVVAIAKGDVPQHHWFQLGRLVASVHGRATLVSWGGTMFEYLMPLLLTRSYPGTMLDQSCRASVRRQIEYGREHGVPWGVSESAYAFTDRAGTYQYRAFGVPGLGLRRGLAEDLVVSPYATALASQVNPAAAAANLSRLAAIGLDGRFGFYEAVDFRPLLSRDAIAGRGATPVASDSAREIAAAGSASHGPVIVQAFFAHHQGMSLVALANVVSGDRFVERFHADPRVRATELLLQERIPREAILSETRPADATARTPRVPVFALRRYRSPHALCPHTHFLSNGRYTTALTHAGGGFSTFRNLAVVRRRDDRTSDAGAHFLYLRESATGDVWSPTYLPLCREPRVYDVTFELEKATFRQRHGDIETLLQAAVSPEDDVEVRRLAITNRGDRPCTIEVTSCVEIVLARPLDDLAHPAFGKLFIETEHDAEHGGLLFSRRPRGADESPVWAFHVLAIEGERGGTLEWETDRARFLGRGRSHANPVALEGGALSGATGAVLDPVAALRMRVDLAPGEFARLAFTTGVAPDRGSALALVGRYHHATAAARVFSTASAQAHVTLQHLGLTDDHAILFDRLASRVFGADSTCTSPDDLARNTLGQPNLWGYGISGDLPIVLVHVTDADAGPLVRQLLHAQEYWRVKNLSADLVILNDHPAEYFDHVHDLLLRVLQDPRWSSWHDRPGGVYLLRADGIPAIDRHLFGAAARVVLRSDLGGLATQIHRSAPWLAAGVEMARNGQRQSTGTWLPRPRPSPVPVPAPALVMESGFGGFTPDGRQYVVVLEGTQETPLPWSNVLANAEFGTIVSASGAAFTWAVNSRENRLTPFANDPLADPTAEAIFVRDDDDGAVWGATPGPLPRAADSGRWVVRHAAGATRYQHRVAGIDQELTVSVPPDDSVKLATLTVTNHSPTRRRLSVFGYAEWCLGPPRPGENRFVVTEVDRTTGVLYARNAYNAEHRERVAFFRATEPARSFTCDRGEFVGRNRSLARPAALLRERLAGRHGAGLDPCAAVQVAIELEPGSSRSIAFVIGQGRDAAEAAALAERYASLAQVEDGRTRAERFWDDMLSTIRVRTPEPTFDVLVNRWLLYQSLACRVWARSGPYQPGGAFGFRDQLQDALALLHARPDLCRAHLVLSASRQFLEGDVQHWWHPPTGRGTRTRCSDDMLWLPYVAAAYIAQTGDESVLDEQAPFLEAPPLEPHQEDAYILPAVSSETGSLFEHCVRAIARASTAGQHGLPLIGAGDWNDGMNRVGHEGRGESVWLGWFLATVLQQFAPLCERRNLHERAEQYRREARSLAEKLEDAWDGNWYRRAYFDDGTPLGSAESPECRIDSLTQSWSVLSGIARRDRAEQAMEAVRAHLVRRDAKLVLLLTPPFDKMPNDPGYIKGYLPGVRENGGQYTHAAIWTIIALARLGRGDDAMELFTMINPINHARTADAVGRYRVEPYVVAADVYAHPMHVGRGGWTWYTGSAGWMYQAAIEGLLGLRRRGQTFSLTPRVPAEWPGYSLEWKVGRSMYVVEVTNPERRGGGILSADLDGVMVDPVAIPLIDDGQRHQLVVVLGAATAAEPIGGDRRGEPYRGGSSMPSPVSLPAGTDRENS